MFTQNGIKNFETYTYDTTINPFFKEKYCFNINSYAVSSAGGRIKMCLKYYQRYIVYMFYNANPNVCTAYKF